MSHQYVQPPDLFPILSPGKHRSPRTGACFMELASLLAGERWSDHPACTHPLLAAVARHVNDHTSDAGRQRLAELIPSVIGLTGDDLHIDARIALRSAIMALPVVAAGRQPIMAVSVLTCERVLADLDGRAAAALEEQSRLALAEVPQAAEWAYRFTSGVRPSGKGFRRQAAPTIVQDAVQSIAQACVPDPDGMLRDLLVQAIAVCAVWSVATGPRWDGRSQLVDERVLTHGESVPVRLILVETGDRLSCGSQLGVGPITPSGHQWRGGSKGCQPRRDPAGGRVMEARALGGRRVQGRAGTREDAITMARSSGNAFFANFSTYHAPFPTKVRLALANSWRKVRTRSGCCGNYGQPGC